MGNNQKCCTNPLPPEDNDNLYKIIQSKEKHSSNKKQHHLEDDPEASSSDA